MVLGVGIWIALAGVAVGIIIYSQVCSHLDFKRLNKIYIVQRCEPCDGKGYHVNKHVSRRCTACSGHGVREVY